MKILIIPVIETWLQKVYSESSYIETVKCLLKIKTEKILANDM